MEAIAAAVPAWEPEHPTAPDQAAEDEARAEAEEALFGGGEFLPGVGSMSALDG